MNKQNDRCPVCFGDHGSFSPWMTLGPILLMTLLFIPLLVGCDPLVDSSESHTTTGDTTTADNGGQAVNQDGSNDGDNTTGQSNKDEEVVQGVLKKGVVYVDGEEVEWRIVDGELFGVIYPDGKEVFVPVKE